MRLTPEAVAQACGLLLSGATIKEIAYDLGASAGHVFRMVRVAGLLHVWTTAEERAALVEMRSGRAVLVPKDAAAPAIRLRARLDAAIAEYRGEAQAGGRNTVVSRDGA